MARTKKQIKILKEKIAKKYCEKEVEFLMTTATPYNELPFHRLLHYECKVEILLDVIDKLGYELVKIKSKKESKNGKGKV